MPSARTQCPQCAGQIVVTLDRVLYSANADFLQCAGCDHLWHVPKGEEGPASVALLGKKTFKRAHRSPLADWRLSGVRPAPSLSSVRIRSRQASGHINQVTPLRPRAPTTKQ